MAFCGTFVLKSNENFEAYLAAIGVPADIAARMAAAKPELEVSKIAGGVSVKTTSGDKVFTNSLVFGADSEADIGGLKYTLNVAKSDDGYAGSIKLGSKSGTVSVAADAAGFTQTQTVDGVTAKRFYDRK